MCVESLGIIIYYLIASHTLLKWALRADLILEGKLATASLVDM